MTGPSSPGPSSPGPAVPDADPPIAARRPVRREHHGDVVTDQYEWLRDKGSAEVTGYLEAENAFTAQKTAHLEDLRRDVFAEIRARVQETDLSVPVRDGGWWYYARTVEGSQYALQCRAPAGSEAADPGALDTWTPPQLVPGEAVPGEQVLLDCNAEAAGHEFFALGSFAVSDDGTRLAYAVDTDGDERYTLRIKDLETGGLLPDQVEGTFPGALWSPDGAYVFYPTVDEAWRPDTIRRHRVGTDPSEDAVVFTEPDERFWLGMGVTRSRRFLVIELASKVTSESWIIPADDPTGEPRVVLPRREGVEYEVDHVVVGGEDRLLILHNDGAQNFRLDQAPIDRPTELSAVLAHRAHVRLEEVDAFAGHVVVGYREEAIPKVGVMAILGAEPNAGGGPAAGGELSAASVGQGEGGPSAGGESSDPAVGQGGGEAAGGFGELREIAFDEQLYSAGMAATPEWESPLLRVAQASYITPARVYDYAFATGALHLRKQQAVLADPAGRAFDPAAYEQFREWATAQDGTRIPLSVIRRRDAPPGPAATLLYGYGSYEISEDPGFSIARLSLLDRGMTYAVAHVRGGGEMGRGWYEDGKKLAKRNTFTDFTDCAQHLIDTGRTTPDRLVAEGGSAGGMLMGAIANQAPELFAGILAVVPFVDPLTSVLDPSLPLTVIEWDEWGDPLHDPEVYRYMRSYSPYENVEARTYPAIMAVTSINDTRVLYVEPAKWVARLRHELAQAGMSSEHILLKTEMAAGHGGVSGRYDKWRQTAFEYAWVLAASGAG